MPRLPSRPRGEAGEGAHGERRARAAPEGRLARAAPEGRRARVAPGILDPGAPEILRGSGAAVRRIEDWLAEAIGAGRLRPGNRCVQDQGPGRLVQGEPDDAAPGAGQARRRGLVTRTIGAGGGTAFVTERQAGAGPHHPCAGSPSSCGAGCGGTAGAVRRRHRAGPVSAAAHRLAEGDPVHEDCGSG